MKKIIAGLLVFTHLQIVAQVTLPAIIADNMVLQQNKPNMIWGTAKRSDKIAVQFKNQLYLTTANAKGEWKIVLPSCKAGAAGNLEITCNGQVKKISNILVGEVWVCSGQSNMEWKIGLLKETYMKEIKAANNDAIRFVVLNNRFNNQENKQVSLQQSWVAIDSATVNECSAVAYFFAKQLQQKLKVPIGLIISSWGGTPIQSWMDSMSLVAFPDKLQEYLSKIKPLNLDSISKKQIQNEVDYERAIPFTHQEFKKILDPSYNDDSWENIKVPQNWELQGHPGLDGIAVYRLAVNLSAEDLNQSAILQMPAIDDKDSTFINGIFIGNTNSWNMPRQYPVAKNIFKPGKNIISIRVEDTGGGGGFNHDPQAFYIATGDKKIMLKDTAKFKILAIKEQGNEAESYRNLQNQPAVLFNAMIAPLLNYTIKGAIWYQGESDANAYVQYRSLFPAMINGWRKRFNQGSFPFLFVQLSSYDDTPAQPDLNNWAYLRESQSATLKLPNTAMAVTIDIGERNDIHPKKKKEVGDRLAYLALKKYYGNPAIIAEGPTLSGTKLSENSIKLLFSNTGNGLVIKGENLQGFYIAAADKKFLPATAIKAGNGITVSNIAIHKPLYVRYAWENVPLKANLFNSAGLPASPFRTDVD